MPDSGGAKIRSASALKADALVSAHYGDFCKVAARVLNGDASTLQLEPTDLAHEAVIRLSRLERLDCQGRIHFLALSARLMRQIVIDEFRKLRAAKRQKPLNFGSSPFGLDPEFDSLESLDRALRKLAIVAPDHAKLVDQRFFVGLTLEEIAETENVSVSTVKRQWRATSLWLARELRPR